MLVLAFVLATVVGPRRAAAADVPSGSSIVVAAGYVLPIGCSALTGTYHAAYLLYGEGAPMRWRTAAWICGGISIGVGTYVLVDDAGATTDGTVLGIVPIVVGTGAVLAALFVGAPDDTVGNQARLTPWIGKGSGGLVWSGRF